MDPKMQVESELVLTIENQHVAGAGKPPDIKATPNDKKYTAYFENDCGEQLLFQYDKSTKVGTLWHGDIHWEKPMVIEGGMAPGDTILNMDETVWLGLVWAVATRFETPLFKVQSQLRGIRRRLAVIKEAVAGGADAQSLDLLLGRTSFSTVKGLEKQEVRLVREEARLIEGK